VSLFSINPEVFSSCGVIAIGSDGVCVFLLKIEIKEFQIFKKNATIVKITFFIFF
jgi:hypothetical protein